MASAASISARAKPKVRFSLGGRPAKWMASSAMPRPSASVAMWAASATRASESASRPPTISATITKSVMPSAIRSLPRWAEAAVPVAGPCVCP